jgi:hypothetical protein
VTDVAKRILLGRKLKSDQLGETLLPKRIALPVFASDALSSVAYAPDEIFIMLSTAGAAAYVWSWKIGIAVALVMIAVIMSYRQTVHAYPSGGGDYEVATTNLGPLAGVTVASALLVDYVLTVAVSISSGAQYAASAIGFLSGHEAAFAVILVVILTALNLRGVKESGTYFAIPTYLFMVAIIGMCVVGMTRFFMGDLPLAESAKLHIEPTARFAGGGVTGDLQRRACVPQAQEQERRDNAGHAGRGRDHHDDQRHRAGQRDGHPLRGPAQPAPTDHAERPAGAPDVRRAHRHRPDRAGRLQHLPCRLLLRGGGDRGDPGPGGQHRVQRLPGARLDPGP